MDAKQTQIVLDLTKAFELNLEKAQIFDIPVMETRLAVDKSGSMNEEFSAGWVDHVIDLFIAAAMKFDDNGLLDVGFFNNSFHSAPQASKEDVGLYTKRHGIRAGGGTNYAPVLDNMGNVSGKVGGFLKKLFGSKEQAPAPVYLGMITDGECYDADEFESKLKALAGKRIFVQIIGLGDEVDVAYLRRLERENSHVSFIHLLTPKTVDDNQFYEEICNDRFKNWLATL